MKRHKLWDDRAHRLFQKTLESWSEKQITENTEVKQVQENSLLDMDDYNMLAKAVQGPAEKLLADGYTKEDFVESPGQFAIRGSVMDLFLTSNPEPIRIEHFEDKIETLRTFNPESQITNEKVMEVNFLPSYEYPLNIPFKYRCKQK